MNHPKAYGTFIKRGENTYRTSAYIQWGSSEQSIGACLLLNPGSADFHKINPDLNVILNTLFRAKGEIMTDPTMKQLILLIEGIYGQLQPIAGRFHIYNLFNLQNPKSIHAIDLFEALVHSGEYDITESLISLNELQTHPWIFTGWGIEQKVSWKNLEKIKDVWLNLIRDSKVPTFGKKHKTYNNYYHPCPLIPTHRSHMLTDLLSLYKQKFSIQRFPTYAARPNLLNEANLLEECDQYQLGWFRSSTNPESILKGFSHLHIKENYKLRAYQYSDGANGNGVVWAIPVNMDLPPANECECLEEHFLIAPKPAFALDDCMQVIDGDKSPLSYLQASVAFHDIHEFGAFWHGTSWGRDVILPINEGENADKYQWKMIEDEPATLEPHFYYSNLGNPTIVFHTINDIGTVTMNRYVHTFSKSDYTLRVERTCIATAGGGIIF
ncbi:hypothetical protein [Paenibacillus sp. FSL L8-0708]|uniref:hypothetical protein n=1 Tax=Paenibacillus sp. FSL L8-0708 TaxID=2975311 RepID=UPI0030F6F40A